jgi:beta-glucosidase
VSAHDNSFSLTAHVKVENTGKERGSTVAQLYVGLPDIGITHPKLQLRGFAKTHDLAAGEAMTVEIHLGKYAVSYWDTPRAKWRADAGEYTVRVGDSSAHLPLEAKFKLEKAFTWSGL